MSNIPSANQKIQIEATTQSRPTSESLLQTIGGSVNYAIDGIASNAAAIATETTNRINADNALDARLDAVQYLRPNSLVVSEGAGTLAVGNDDVSYSTTNDSENWYTIILNPTTYSGSPVGRITVWLNNTIFSGQDMLSIRIEDIIDSWIDTGIQGGTSVSFYLPVGTTAFPNGTTVNIRVRNNDVSVTYRLVKRTVFPTLGV